AWRSSMCGSPVNCVRAATSPSCAHGKAYLPRHRPAAAQRRARGRGAVLRLSQPRSEKFVGGAGAGILLCTKTKSQGLTKSASNPKLLTHLADFSVQEVNFEHIF